MTEAAALAFLHDLPRFAGVADAAYKPGLDRMRALLGALGDPHEAFRSVHVAGTNGKGSVAAILESVLRHHGLRTGLYTSPHLVDFRERIQLDKAGRGRLLGRIAFGRLCAWKGEGFPAQPEPPAGGTAARDQHHDRAKE